DLLAIDANAFVDLFEMRRSVKPGSAACVPQNRLKERSCGTLAIRSCDMRCRVGALRMAQPLGEDRNSFQVKLCGSGLRRRSQLSDERKQVPNGIVVIHFSSTAGRGSWR